ncbi:hypothetical protein BLOT_002990 [Blomia tropicalis]|nr:hypothetical protein BLOT_002990 [Blomia tropicalis]
MDCEDTSRTNVDPQRQQQDHQQRVQFAESNQYGHNADIQVQVMNQCMIKVHLGFLQVRHRYEIEFSFECPESMENIFDLQTCSLPGHVPQLYAYKEKLFKEKIYLQSKSQRSQSLSFVFYGRVLGTGKGTPFLKQGIRSIGFELDEDDYASDMQAN